MPVALSLASSCWTPVVKIKKSSPLWEQEDGAPISRKPTAEQEARFERFCAALEKDITLNAYRAAIEAGYTPRMAKSKSYKLAERAMKRRGFMKAWHLMANVYAAQVDREYTLDRLRRRASLRTGG